MNLPPINRFRHARSTKVICPTSYCSQGLMRAQCVRSQSRRLSTCSEGKRLPSCWFAMIGTRSDQYFGHVQQFYHHLNVNVSCLPCCHISSNHSKMPSENAIMNFNILIYNLSLCRSVVC